LLKKDESVKIFDLVAKPVLEDLPTCLNDLDHKVIVDGGNKVEHFVMA
jgi:hypothetical protein